MVQTGSRTITASDPSHSRLAPNRNHHTWDLNSSASDRNSRARELPTAAWDPACRPPCGRPAAKGSTSLSPATYDEAGQGVVNPLRFDRPFSPRLTTASQPERHWHQGGRLLPVSPAAQGEPAREAPTPLGPAEGADRSLSAVVMPAAKAKSTANELASRSKTHLKRTDYRVPIGQAQTSASDRSSRAPPSLFRLEERRTPTFEYRSGICEDFCPKQWIFGFFVKHVTWTTSYLSSGPGWRKGREQEASLIRRSLLIQCSNRRAEPASFDLACRREARWRVPGCVLVLVDQASGENPVSSSSRRLGEWAEALSLPITLPLPVPALRMASGERIDDQ
ncbi:hypothetical protein KSP40_PGU021521 [Platanthera guangdongensis]|uniref:Uncharacterized protein n=1 Tax=Platanthera guangdongensis TaxID=2320717 RepID=A0ABR2LZC8_9ASPA